MTETAQLENCLRCENTGYIIWMMMMQQNGPVRYEIRPGDPNISKVKHTDYIIDKCDCENGNVWQPKT